MLALAMDPAKSLGMLGRVKREGVSALFDNSVLDHNRRTSTQPIDMLAVVTENVPDIADSVSFIEAFPENMSGIAQRIFMTATKTKPPAFPIFIGGANFTGDILQDYHRENLPFALMSNAPGASAQRAPYVAKAKHFTSGIELLQTIDRQVAAHPERFGHQRPFEQSLYTKALNSTQLDPAKLKALEEEAVKNVLQRERSAHKALANGNGRH
jgi:hypothetical protein